MTDVTSKCSYKSRLPEYVSGPSKREELEDFFVVVREKTGVPDCVSTSVDEGAMLYLFVFQAITI